VNVSLFNDKSQELSTRKKIKKNQQQVEIQVINPRYLYSFIFCFVSATLRLMKISKYTFSKQKAAIIQHNDD